MAKRVARKIKRAGKLACQFKFTSTFEYIDLDCKGGWRPDNLKVIWLRSHRRAQSINVEWVCTDDRGPNGATGRAVFDPPIAASLIVTLYKDSKKPYEEKEYKYYIENEGPGGRKILASFTCDMAEYAGIPSSRHALEMNFKPISSKIKKSYLGITLESEFIKEGNANDDDMQSTFSAVEPGTEEMVFADEIEDEDDEDDLDEAATLGHKIISDMTNNNGNVIDVETSTLLLGTGETLKRSAVKTEDPPPKPPRTGSLMNLLDDADEDINTMNNITNDPSNPTETPDNTTSIPDPSSTPDNTTSIPDPSSTPDNTTSIPDPSSTPDTTSIPDPSSPIRTPDNTTSIPDPSSPIGTPDNTTSIPDPSSPIGTPDNTTSIPDPSSPIGTPDNTTSIPDPSSPIGTPDNTTSIPDPSSPIGTPDTTSIPDPSSLIGTPDNTTSIPDPSSPIGTPDNTTSIPDPSSLTPDNTTIISTLDNTAIHTTINNNRDNTNTLYCTDNNHSKPSANTKTSTPDEPIIDPPTNNNNDDTTVCPPEETTTTDQKKEEEEEQQQQQQCSSSNDELSWLQDIELVDHNDTDIGIGRLSSADVIAFYFSASWCPPCKTFLPNLKKFYTALKDNDKSFEMVYVSSDYSREEMVAYMGETTMPWTAIRYGHKLADRLRQDYTVRVIPILVIVTRSGDILEENAKKQVDKASTASSSTAACIQLYNKWVEKMTNPVPEQKTTILGNIKKALSKDETPSPKGTRLEETRETAESKTPKSNINSGGNKEELIKQLQEKENVIRQLEEVNLSLKHTNDDLNDEVRGLKSKVDLLNNEVKSMRETDAQKKENDEMFKEYLKLQGWLFKRGAKGPTANKWRRRYFRLDQGSKLYYYKNHTEGTPQGFIDILKIISVMELTGSQQDKNNASFNIECEGRTYQLQAYDEAEMRRWITAISKLKEFYLKQADKNDA